MTNGTFCFGIDNSSSLKSLLKHDDFHDDDNY